MRVLRHYVLAGAKVAAGVAGQSHTVPLAGNQLHLDAPMGFVEAGMMTEQLGLEVGIQLSVDDVENIQVERGSDAAGPGSGQAARHPG